MWIDLLSAVEVDIRKKKKMGVPFEALIPYGIIVTVRFYSGASRVQQDTAENRKTDEKDCDDRCLALLELVLLR